MVITEAAIKTIIIEIGKESKLNEMKNWKDMTDEQRKMVAGHIAKVRVEEADKLQRIREHTDENGNYKA